MSRIQPRADGSDVLSMHDRKTYADHRKRSRHSALHLLRDVAIEQVKFETLQAGKTNIRHGLEFERGASSSLHPTDACMPLEVEPSGNFVAPAAKFYTVTVLY